MDGHRLLQLPAPGGINGNSLSPARIQRRYFIWQGARYNKVSGESVIFCNKLTPLLPSHILFCSVSVYLTDVKCEKKMNHILRCKHKAKQEEYSAQQRVIALTCHNKITKKYEGQISLYPPDGLSPYQSVSTGVISLYSGKDPLFIIQNDEPPLTSNAANTFCRQMGFTKYIPESVMSIADAYQRHGYTFDNFLSDV